MAELLIRDRKVPDFFTESLIHFLISASLIKFTFSKKPCFPSFFKFSAFLNVHITEINTGPKVYKGLHRGLADAIGTSCD